VKAFFRKNKGIAGGIISLVVFVIFSLFPALADGVYREFIFQIFRVIWDHTIGLLPFPIIYLLLVALPVILYFYGRKFERKKITLLLFPLNLIGWIITFFLWMWGYNYCATPLIAENKPLEMTTNDIYQFGLEVAKEVNMHLDPSGGHDENQIAFLQAMEQEKISPNEISDCIESYLKQQNRNTLGRARCVELDDAGFLRRMGISGVYLPFVGQGHSTSTHRELVGIFVRAHETSHAYGITGEGEADYVAYMALKQLRRGSSQLQTVKRMYAADLELLRSIRSQLYIMNDSLRIALDSTLSPFVLEEIRLIREDSQKYQQFFPGVQHKMNDTYLKMMGVQDGILNYDRFVEMVWNDRRQK
jgi:hypothetical protein